MITDILNKYYRFEFKGNRFYINGDLPDWITLPPRSDRIIHALQQGKSLDSVATMLSQEFNVSLQSALFEIESLVSRFETGPVHEYNGRGDIPLLDGLLECWLHITNRCNMACRHCMFSWGPDSDQAEMKRAIVDSIIDDALDYGCRIFYFTGGEPFVYPKFTDIIDYILTSPQTEVVILTNLRTIQSHEQWLQKIDRKRVHFQVSIDGTEENHDWFRGQGAYRQLLQNLEFLTGPGFSVTFAMSVTKRNVKDMSALPAIAKKAGVGNLHFMWLFVTGKADEDLFIPPQDIFPYLAEAFQNAKNTSVQIDNFETVRSQIFSLPGTRFDSTNAGFESLAVGPDGSVYPTPALIGVENMRAGKVSGTDHNELKNILVQSEVFNSLRASSLMDSDSAKSDPMRFLTGGGDLDHSYYSEQTFSGDDPYSPLYNQMVLMLLNEHTEQFSGVVDKGIYCRMGERILDCSALKADVNFTHSNCVLSLHGVDGYTPVRQFYDSAALESRTDIINPVLFEPSAIQHIPQEVQSKNYGCGSPVGDCQLQLNERVVDIGCGAGMECMIAAKIVGRGGMVYGIDMSDSMLEQAESAGREMRKTLGYDNLEFKKGYLEEIPIGDGSVDVVISNCVINLSPDKRKTFLEIKRVLKPGGRLCISDIVSTTHIPLDIQYNEKLRGECIGGALQEKDLYALPGDLGFSYLQIVKRFPYREVAGHTFYSVTYMAFAPGDRGEMTWMYRGPHRAIISESGEVIPRGHVVTSVIPSKFQFDETALIFDQKGFVTNHDMESCCVLPEGAVGVEQSPLTYDGSVKVETMDTNTVDQIFERIMRSYETDLVTLFREMRNYPGFPPFGPHHHPLIPAIVLVAYMNSGGSVTERDIQMGIERGKLIPPASCSFLGIDGAAVGIAIAFSIILGANPYDGEGRHIVQKVAAAALLRISGYKASRCCLRECWTALTVASDLSSQYLDIPLAAEGKIVCDTRHLNKGCIGKKCPLWQP